MIGDCVVTEWEYSAS